MKKVVKFFKRAWKVLLVILIIIVIASLIRKNSELKEDVAKMESIAATQEEDAGLNNGSESSGLVALDEEVQRQVEEDQIQNEEIELLKTEMAELQRRLNLLDKEGTTKTVKSQNAKDNVEEYLDIKFPFDGNYYRDIAGIQFYANPSCTEKISNVILSSVTYDNDNAENGLAIKCWRMENGDFCYSTETPQLVTEAEYEQILSEQDK